MEKNQAGNKTPDQVPPLIHYKGKQSTNFLYILVAKGVLGCPSQASFGVLSQKLVIAWLSPNLWHATWNLVVFLRCASPKLWRHFLTPQLLCQEVCGLADYGVHPSTLVAWQMLRRKHVYPLLYIGIRITSSMLFIVVRWSSNLFVTLRLLIKNGYKQRPSALLQTEYQ